MSLARRAPECVLLQSRSEVRGNLVKMLYREVGLTMLWVAVELSASLRFGNLESVSDVWTLTISCPVRISGTRMAKRHRRARDD